MNASAARIDATIVPPSCVMSISLRRSKTSAATPLTSENKMIGTTRTSPTIPSASPLCAGVTSSETCQRIAACCMNDPANDTKRLSHSNRKLRWRSARVFGSNREDTMARVRTRRRDSDRPPTA